PVARSRYFLSGPLRPVGDGVLNSPLVGQAAHFFIGLDPHLVRHFGSVPIQRTKSALFITAVDAPLGQYPWRVYRWISPDRHLSMWQYNGLPFRSRGEQERG